MPPALQEFAARLEERRDRCRELPVLLGFDGTVDCLYSAVGLRKGTGEAFDAIASIDAFGKRISGAAGKSGCIELFPRRQKIGGNGPILSGALAACGLPVAYIGPLGQPQLHPIFHDFAQSVDVHSIGSPAITHAVEFQDGKIMLPVLQSYDSVSAETLRETLGKETLVRLIERTKLAAFLNWTCLPEMPGILELFLTETLPAATPDPERLVFFDLADPAMRAPEELRAALDQIAAFQTFGQCLLGLNFSEASQVAAVLGLEAPQNEELSLRRCAAAIRERLDLATVFIHPVDCAASADRDGTAFVRGPYCPNPTITTGAGDHLNAGVCLGKLLKLSSEDCLRLGTLFSGFYVRSGQSPSLSDILRFIGELDAQATHSPPSAS